MISMQNYRTETAGALSLAESPLQHIEGSSLQPMVLAIADPAQKPLYGTISLRRATVAHCTFQQSLQVVKERRPQVAILDCGPNADFGLALARRIKTEEAAIPIIFVTEVSSEEIVIEAFRTGVREFLKKPIEIGRLSECIEYLLNIRKASQEKRIPFSRGINSERADAVRYRPTIPKNMLNVVSFIESNLQSDLSLDLLAEKALVSKYHFCKVFKKHFEMSPLKFVAHKRIERARELLLSPDHNITDTAMEVGFHDTSSFSKLFRKMTGFTPMAYRSFYRQLGKKRP